MSRRRNGSACSRSDFGRPSRSCAIRFVGFVDFQWHERSICRRDPRCCLQSLCEQSNIHRRPVLTRFFFSFAPHKFLINSTVHSALNLASSVIEFRILIIEADTADIGSRNCRCLEDRLGYSRDMQSEELGDVCILVFALIPCP